MASEPKSALTEAQQNEVTRLLESESFAESWFAPVSWSTFQALAAVARAADSAPPAQQDVWAPLVSAGERLRDALVDCCPGCTTYIDDWDSAVADAPRWKIVTEEIPELGDHAWIVWCGVLQEQPWCWQELDDGRPGWVHGESEISEGEGVTHWWPLPLPAPPVRKGE